MKSNLTLVLIGMGLCLGLFGSSAAHAATPPYSSKEAPSQATTDLLEYASPVIETRNLAPQHRSPNHVLYHAAEPLNTKPPGWFQKIADHDTYNETAKTDSASFGSMFLNFSQVNSHYEF